MLRVPLLALLSCCGHSARLTPFEVGSDAAGSIRVPAHFCGILGFKPTDRLIPWAGHIPELPGSPRVFRQCVSIGPLARSVRDLELLTRTIAGPHPRDWEVPPISLQPVAPPAVAAMRLRWCSSFGDEVTDLASARLIEQFTPTDPGTTGTLGLAHGPRRGVCEASGEHVGVCELWEVSAS